MDCALDADNIAKYHLFPKNSHDNLIQIFMGEKSLIYIWKTGFH